MLLRTLQELRFWLPGWLPPTPVEPILLVNSKQTKKQKDQKPNSRKNNDHHKENAGAPTPKQPTGTSSLWPEVQSWLLNSPVSPEAPAQQGPGSAPPGRLHTQLTPSLTQGSPWHRQRLGMVPLMASRGSGSPVIPATDQLRDLGPMALGTCVWGAGGTAMERFGKSHAEWKINMKRHQSLAALLPLDGMGRVPAGVEGGRRIRRGGQASRWQVLSRVQGWPPTMLASGLAPQAGSSLLMGEGNTVSDCTNPLRSIRLGGRGPQSTAQQLVIILLWL